MAGFGNPVVVFHMDTTKTSIDSFIAYMSSVLGEMRVFNFYVWYDSSQLSIPEYTVQNDTEYGIGATFFNHGRKWGYVGGSDCNAIIELHRLSALNRETLTATIDYSIYAEEWPTPVEQPTTVEQPVSAEQPVDAAYLEARVPKEVVTETPAVNVGLAVIQETDEPESEETDELASEETDEPADVKPQEDSNIPADTNEEPPSTPVAKDMLRAP
ncbi:hypothetical protein GGI14_000653 [Coemansia sp. S680]|nr:hypothetical protein GGI14_000653 [Coemansia sp. S680]